MAVSGAMHGHRVHLDQPWVRRCGKSLLVALLLLVITHSRVIAAQQDDYYLSVGDVIELDLLDDDEPPSQLTVGNDGRILVPLLGSVFISGMKVSDVIAKLSKEYKERELLVDPKVAIGIVSFRPIFVIGDVRSPGQFPFHPLLTVEQAVGLAGGPATALSNAEDRILARTKVQGDLERIESEIEHAAATAARLLAKLDNRSAVALKDIPETARPYINSTHIDSLLKDQGKVLAIEIGGFEKEESLLAENVGEAQHGLEVLEEMVTNQKVTIKYSQQDLERAQTLFKKGLQVATQISQIQRQLTSDEGRLLTIYSQVSESHRAISNLKRELSQLVEGWRRDGMLQLEDQKAKVNSLIIEHRSAEQQLALLASWTSVQMLQNRQIGFDYKVRRRIANRSEDLLVTPTSDLFPGDVLLVTIRKPEVAQR